MAIIRNKPKRSVLANQVPSTNTSVGEVLMLAKENSVSLTPLDINALIRAFGIKVIREPMDDDISGHLTATDNGWRITVNALHHPRRQRFTLAHELAHYLLHRWDKDDFVDKTLFRGMEVSPMEREANSFAAGLLMPEDEFKRYIREVSSKVEDVAEYFAVSALAVRVRARELGFTGHGL